MLIRMRGDATDEETNTVRAAISRPGRAVHEIDGAFVIVSGTDANDLGRAGMNGVASSATFDTPYRLVHRSVRPEGTRVRVGTVEVGPDAFAVAAGPCAVESETQLDRAADAVARAGAVLLRGGAYKPRTSPYAFQGLKEDGLRLLRRAADRYQMPVVTEVLATEDVDLVAEYADVLQIGARNMQNFALLEAAGRAGRPVLLKRGLSATIEEFLLAAEYIALQGNLDIILCERGIRTFETATRNTLDLGAAIHLRELTHLPVVVDPSHATGRRALVAPLARAAAAAGVDGLIIEVHPNPECALCDGPQSVPAGEFAALMGDLAGVLPASGRAMHSPAAGLAPEHVLDLESARLARLDADLARIGDERRSVGLRIEELRSKIGRPPAGDSDSREREAKEIHAPVG
jgi:3-deoxy-7-phosphoheptulonate synthase